MDRLLLDLVKRFEGFSPVPYRCPAGYWTIGFGSLCQESHPRITVEEGEAMLVRALEAYRRHALRLSPALEGRRLVAVIDFVYNLGPTRYAGSSFRKHINAEAWEAAARSCLQWVYGGGRVLPGLVRRRQAEALMLV